MSYLIAEQLGKTICRYVLPHRHRYDTRLRRATDTAVRAAWPSCAAETAAATGRCQVSLWCFQLLCAEYEGLLDTGRAVKFDHERFQRAYADTIRGIVREMRPHGRFLRNAAWDDLLYATQNHAAWAFSLADRADIPLPLFA